VRDEQFRLARNEPLRKFRQALEPVLGEAEVDREVPAILPAEFAQAP
jgi:hypothetical protein